MSVGYLGNTFHDIEKALKDGKNGITLNRLQMEQVLSENAALIEKANELVRENNELREDCVTELPVNLNREQSAEFRRLLNPEPKAHTA